MLWFFESFFLWCESLFFSIGRSRPPVPKPPSASSRLPPVSCVLIFLIAIVLLSTTRIRLPWLYLQLWPVGLLPFWLGAAVTIAGLLFAVWEREHLGSNWNRSVTIKHGHELITTGPYAWSVTPSTPAF